VRPNQGIVAPNSTETVSILLVEKDKQILLQSYDRLGQSALDHSKDKFLVQSCAAPDEFASLYDKEKRGDEQKSDGYKTSKEMAEKLTSLWDKTSTSGESPVFNKKLHVRHVVMEIKSGTPDQTTQVPTTRSDKTPVENMSPEQMFSEVSSLRRKYDELVAFSVNLTAERDILNNSLEQTKRDLNREIAAKKTLRSCWRCISRFEINCTWRYRRIFTLCRAGNGYCYSLLLSRHKSMQLRLCRLPSIRAHPRSHVGNDW